MLKRTTQTLLCHASEYAACKGTSAVVGMTGERAVQHSQGQAGATRPCVQEQEQGAEQDVRRPASRAGGAA